jgi:hypothetical protein
MPVMRFQISLATLLVCVTVLAVVGAATIAPAATVSLSANITGTYDINAPNSQLASGFLWDGQPHIYGVGVFAQVFNILPGQSFGAAAFDVNIGSVLSRISVTNANVAANYRANNPVISNVFDENGSPIPRYYSGGDNSDLGTSSSDLVGIVIDVDGATLGKTFDANHMPTPDPRQAIGIGAPFLLGSIFVRWDGTQNTEMTFAHAAYAFAPFNGPLGPDIGDTTIAPVQFVVPEPATAMLIAASALPALWIIRRLKSRRENGPPVG